MFGSKLRRTLTAALEDPKSLGDRIRSVSGEQVRTAAEAELVVRVLKRFPLPPASCGERAVGSPLHDVVAWMQGAEAEEAVAVFRQLGTPELLRVFDDTMAAASSDDALRIASDLLFLLKIVSMYAPEGGLERLTSAVRSPLLREGYLWSVIFGIVFRYEYPPRAGETKPEIGHGMVGSVTFALFGESTGALPAEQVYALHCAWELQTNDDPRAPKKRTVEAGMQTLREYNPGFGRA